MKIVKWVLIVLVVVFVIVLTLPSGGYFDCQHIFVTDACNVSHCTKCGEISTVNAKHDWDYTTCKSICKKCGITGPNSHSLTNIPCTNQVYCTKCDYTATRSYVMHNTSYTDRIMTDPCHYYLKCKDCGQIIESGTHHTWSTKKTCTDVSCVYCGTAAPDSYAHRYLRVTDMFDLPAICQDCGKWYFPSSAVGTVCILLGLFMCVTAFIFVYMNRKRITIREGRYFRAATPEAQMQEKGTEEEYI